MKKSSILFYLFLFAIGTNQVSAHHPVRSANDTLSAKVDQIFADWDKPDSPGCALAVIQDGKTVYSRGYGMADLEHDIPISPQTVFYIGSTSKQFVTFSIALLAEQGKLGLDDNIRKYLPEFPDYGQPITIRHLIHHTSGIRDYLTLWSLAGRNYLDYMPEDVVLDMICRQKELNFSPGEQHLYSNSCYFLLAVIVERASGQSLREYADKHIFKPLAMKNTHFHDNNKHIIKKRAYGYAPGKIGGFDQLIMRFDLVGSGGLYTCVEDLYLWDQNFYHNKLGKGGQEIIDLMHTNGKLNNGKEIDYALALVNGTYKGLKTVQHGGALGGYRAQLLRFPEQQFSVIILSNLASFSPGQMAYKVADVYLADQLRENQTETAENPDVTDRKTISIDPAILAKYTGKYELQPGFVITITRENDQLMAQATGQAKFSIFPESETKFYYKIVNAQITFQADQREKVTQIILHQGGRDMPAKKINAEDAKEIQLAEYTGEYYSSELQVTYNVFMQTDSLFVRVGSSPKTLLEMYQKDIFAGPGIKGMIIRNENGKITGFTLDAGRVKNLKLEKKE